MSTNQHIEAAVRAVRDHGKDYVPEGMTGFEYDIRVGVHAWLDSVGLTAGIVESATRQIISTDPLALALEGTLHDLAEAIRAVQP